MFCFFVVVVVVAALCSSHFIYQGRGVVPIYPRVRVRVRVTKKDFGLSEEADISERTQRGTGRLLVNLVSPLDKLVLLMVKCFVIRDKHLLKFLTCNNMIRHSENHLPQ